MKITKYPDELNPNLILRKKCMIRDFKCPYYGTTIPKDAIDKMLHYNDWHRCYLKEFLSHNDFLIHWKIENWFGHSDEKFHFFSKEKRHKWNKIICECTNCKTEWEGEPFIELNQKDWQVNFSNAFGLGKH